MAQRDGDVAAEAIEPCRDGASPDVSECPAGGLLEDSEELRHASPRRAWARLPQYLSDSGRRVYVLLLH